MVHEQFRECRTCQLHVKETIFLEVSYASLHGSKAVVLDAACTVVQHNHMHGISALHVP